MVTRVWVMVAVLGVVVASAHGQSTSQVYPMTDKDKNHLYQLPPKVNEESIHGMSRSRLWRPYQALGTAYVVERNPGQSRRRGRRSVMSCEGGKVWRQGACRCPYLQEWRPEESKCVCAYGTYLARDGSCRGFL